MRRLSEDGDGGGAPAGGSPGGVSCGSIGSGGIGDFTPEHLLGTVTGPGNKKKESVFRKPLHSYNKNIGIDFSSDSAVRESLISEFLPSSYSINADSWTMERNTDSHDETIVLDDGEKRITCEISFSRIKKQGGRFYCSVHDYDTDSTLQYSGDWKECSSSAGNPNLAAYEDLYRFQEARQDFEALFSSKHPLGTLDWSETGKGQVCLTIQASCVLSGDEFEEGDWIQSEFQKFRDLQNFLEAIGVEKLPYEIRDDRKLQKIFDELMKN